LTRLSIKSMTAAFVILLLTGCASAPLDYPKSESAAITTTDDTYFGRASVDWREESPDRDAFYPLTQGLDAFGMRLALISKAERTVDAQYFLIKPDSAGLVFVIELVKAADRGVRVRLLLDDIFTTVDDSVFMLLNEHPNIELRLFNPISRKGVYIFNYIGHFSLTNRRMHNKSLTVDNQVSIVGGRNIAEEYFQLEEGGEFIDFDALAAGPIVREISASFDTYWNHSLAVPMDAFYDEADAAELESLADRMKEAMAEVGDSVYATAINSPLLRTLVDETVPPFLADSRMIVDDPQKLLEKVSQEQKIVANEIGKALLEADNEVLIFTPYFIPGKRGMEVIEQIRSKGVRVVLLTNSLATNNHTAVHSAYATYRKRVLKAGVELWEARASAADLIAEDGTTESQDLTLHTKGIIIDRRYVFVGSLNLDPRSIDINTEMGVMIDSEPLASLLAERSLAGIPELAYRLKLDEKEHISWHATIDGREVVETKEPHTTAWMRFKAWFMKIAPEKQL
jgi:putative cardiolipin synthase